MLSNRESQDKSEEHLENLGRPTVHIGPSSQAVVEKAIDLVNSLKPELLKEVSDVLVDLKGDKFGEFASNNPHTVYVNLQRIIDEVKKHLNGQPDNVIQEEIIKQVAETIVHESTHRKVYTETKSTSESQPEQAEQELRQQLEQRQSSKHFYRKKISQMTNKIIYNAILLDKSSKEKLEKIYPPRHAKTYDGHVTLEFKPTDYPDNLGKKVNLKVYGYAEDDRASVVAVQVFDVNCQNEIPHITISTSQNTPPAYSNELLSKGYKAVEPFDLTGTVVSFVAGKGYINSVEPPPILPNPTI